MDSGPVELLPGEPEPAAAVAGDGGAGGEHEPAPAARAEGEGLPAGAPAGRAGRRGGPRGGAVAPHREGSGAAREDRRPDVRTGAEGRAQRPLCRPLRRGQGGKKKRAGRG